MKYKVLLLAFVLLYISCTDTNNKTESVNKNNILNSYDSVIYDNEQNVIEKQHYVNGQQIGPQYLYYKDGNIKRVRYHITHNTVFF